MIYAALMWRRRVWAEVQFDTAFDTAARLTVPFLGSHIIRGVFLALAKSTAKSSPQSGSFQ